MEYKGHLDRFVGTAKDYNWKKPLQALAGATHVATSGLGVDPAVRGALSKFDTSDNSSLPAYNGLFGYFGKTTENTVGAVGNVSRGKFGSALGGLINIPGDALSDTADFIAGVRHNQTSFKQAA